MEPAARSDDRTTRSTAVACLAGAAVAGAVVLVEGLITTYPGPASPVAWWTAYGLWVATMMAAADVVLRRTPPPRSPVQVAMVASGSACFLLFPDQGWTAVIFVVNAALVARHASPALTVALILTQTAVVAAGVSQAGWQASDVLLAVLAYGGLQTFSALLMGAARREAEARAELAATHAELRSTMALLEAASRDAERVRIARELHDVLGHQLTALALELEVAAHRTGPDQDPAHAHVLRARGVAKDLLGDVRAAVGEMREPRQGLVPTLTALARATPGLEVSVSVADDGAVAPEQVGAILRLAQEAITNALRHGSAGRVDVEVVADSSGIVVRATDDGCGTAKIVPGHGLTGMRERLESLGGTLVLESQPGAGFTVVGRLPRSAAGRPRGVRLPA